MFHFSSLWRCLLAGITTYKCNSGRESVWGTVYAAYIWKLLLCGHSPFPERRDSVIPTGTSSSAETLLWGFLQLCVLQYCDGFRAPWHFLWACILACFLIVSRRSGSGEDSASTKGPNQFTRGDWVPGCWFVLCKLTNTIKFLPGQVEMWRSGTLGLSPDCDSRAQNLARK